MTITIKDVIHQLTKQIPEVENTVDILKSGQLDTIVKGIGTTFLATQAVIEQAIDLDINLLISHEGAFYSHRDNEGMLEGDPVSDKKRALIEESGIAIFRFHDYIHRYQPDGITEGLLRSLDWKNYIDENNPVSSILTLPPKSLGDIVEEIKCKLSIPYVRVVGEASQVCQRVGILVGYRGGGAHTIPLYHKNELDLMIIGEGPEWEAPEYVRDAIHQGRNNALIVLGHAESEMPGMEYLVETIKTAFPTIPVKYLHEKPIFTIM